MTDGQHNRDATRSLAGLLVAVLGVLAVLLPATAASAATVPAAGNGVGAIHPQTILTVGVHESITAGGNRVRGPSQLQVVSGRCVAAEASTSAARSTLPKLTGSIADSFEGGQYSEVTFRAGQTFSRAEAWSSTGPGHFLGLEGVDTATEAEQAYNLAKWGNPAEVMRTYGLTQDTTMYFGRVAGGEGYQALIPEELDPADILQFLSARPLP